MIFMAKTMNCAEFTPFEYVEFRTNMQ